MKNVAEISMTLHTGMTNFTFQKSKAFIAQVSNLSENM
jgi:hypothetical protein